MPFWSPGGSLGLDPLFCHGKSVTRCCAIVMMGLRLTFSSVGFGFYSLCREAFWDGFVEGQPRRAEEVRWWLVLHFRGLFPQRYAWCFAERVGFAAYLHRALSLVISGLRLMLVGPQTQDCHPMAVSLSSTCTRKDPSSLSALMGKCLCLLR